MKKTDGITKYEMQWQLIRSSIKGSKTDLESKLEEAQAYFLEKRTYDRWERVYNWLEGLERGYVGKDRDGNINRIVAERSWYNALKEKCVIQDSYELDQERESQTLVNASLKAVTCLWKDLFSTNKKWLEKGYYHKECNDFMDKLWNARQDIMQCVSYKYSMDCLADLRTQCGETENKHKFFF